MSREEYRMTLFYCLEKKSSWGSGISVLVSCPDDNTVLQIYVAYNRAYTVNVPVSALWITSCLLDTEFWWVKVSQPLPNTKKSHCQRQRKPPHWAMFRHATLQPFIMNILRLCPNSVCYLQAVGQCMNFQVWRLFHTYLRHHLKAYPARPISA